MTLFDILTNFYFPLLIKYTALMYIYKMSNKVNKFDRIMIAIDNIRPKYIELAE